MGLLDLPWELRAHILINIPDFAVGRTETVGPNVRITPAVCRVCRILREEGLPIYARTGSYILQTDDDHQSPRNRLQLWLSALEGKPLSQVRSVQLSRNWNLKQPARWQGQVGFYLRLTLRGDAWDCATGTYPIHNDMRAMRFECIELLRHVISARLERKHGAGDLGLTRADVEYFSAAMDVIASRPVSIYDMEQGEAGRQSRQKVWQEIEARLCALGGSDAVSIRSFCTPY